ncbi:MAG: glycosyltransferase family 4 protein, partial [Deltaproteobacteria bacterium]|nr:glycosyltransferase family 4 protein [Deltaproteobacteria bacterium]
MKVCFLVSEYFAWGRFGGFGAIARTIAQGLRAAGQDIVVVVPRRKGQRPVEIIDGLEVRSYPGHSIFTTKVFQECDADIYHSFEASLPSFAAQRAMPNRKHIVTCIDPFDANDWKMEFKFDLGQSVRRASIYPLLWGFYGSPLVRSAVQHSDSVFCQADFLRPKVKRLYGLPYEPEFVPNAYHVPRKIAQKATSPTVLYLARWDPRKRPEIFFELAKQFPKVRFIAVGKAHDPKRHANLVARYQNVPNLELVGFVNPFESTRLREIIDQSWI